MVLASPIGDLSFDTDPVVYSPAQITDVQSSYSLDAGELRIDLGALDFDGRDLEISADIGIGSLEVIVPADVTVDADASVAIGQVTVFDRSRGGIGDISTQMSISGENGSLKVVAEGGIGEVIVRAEGDEPAAISELGGGIVYTPVTGPDLEDSYSIGVGEILIDLSELSLDAPRPVDVDVDLGTIRVILPRGFDTRVAASVGLGDLELPDQQTSGPDRSGEFQTGPDPFLELNLEVGAGEIKVEDMR
jgi:predicted membrane protein